MPPSADEVPGRFFATDFRLIRKQQQITLDDVSRTTKIPVEIVDLFEQTGLLDHPRFNQIYLRSFVQQYARAINVSPRSALAALEASLEDRYDGVLADEYLKLPPPPDPPPVFSQPEHQAASPEQDAPPHQDEPPHQETPSQPAAALASTPPSDAGQSDPDAGQSDPDAGQSDPDAHHRYSRESLEKEAAYVPRPRRTEKPTPAAPARRFPTGAVLTGVLLLLLAVVAYFTWPLIRDRAPEQVQQAPAAEEQVEVQPEVALPESIRVVLLAEGGALAGIRLQIDENDSRRYWIEPADSLVFRMEDRFLLTAGPAIEQVRLVVDGVALPKDRLNAAGGLEYDRASIRAIIEAQSQP